MDSASGNSFREHRRASPSAVPFRLDCTVRRLGPVATSWETRWRSGNTQNSAPGRAKATSFVVPTDMESGTCRFHLMGFFVIGACDPLPCVHVAGSHVVVITPNTSRDGRASVCPQWNLIGGFHREPEVSTWTAKVLKTVQPTWPDR